MLVSAPTGMVLALRPVVVPMVVALKVQLLLAGMVAPLRPMLPLPATAVTVPPQVVAVVGAFAMTTPAGRVSVTATPVTADADELLRVTTRTLVSV